MCHTYVRHDRMAGEQWQQVIPLGVASGAWGKLLCSSMASCSRWLGGCGGDGRAGGPGGYGRLSGGRFPCAVGMFVRAGGTQLPSLVAIADFEKASRLKHHSMGLASMQAV